MAKSPNNSAQKRNEFELCPITNIGTIENPKKITHAYALHPNQSYLAKIQNERPRTETLRLHAQDDRNKKHRKDIKRTPVC